jgi:hypothetical protein
MNLMMEVVQINVTKGRRNGLPSMMDVVLSSKDHSRTVSIASRLKNGLKPQLGDCFQVGIYSRRKRVTK